MCSTAWTIPSSARALDADIFELYVAKDVPAAFLLDKDSRVTPVDYGDVCINYDKAYFAQKKLARARKRWKT